MRRRDERGQKGIGWLIIAASQLIGFIPVVGLALTGNLTPLAYFSLILPAFSAGWGCCLLAQSKGWETVKRYVKIKYHERKGKGGE